MPYEESEKFQNAEDTPVAPGVKRHNFCFKNLVTGGTPKKTSSPL